MRPEERRLGGSSRHEYRWEKNIKMNLKIRQCGLDLTGVL
jgi:hypothetical protein